MSNPKKGMGCTNCDCVYPDEEELDQLNTSWVFAWGTTPPSAFPNHERVAMIPNHAAVVSHPDLSAYSDYVLTFNEPELPENHNQAFMTPTQAAQDWRQLELWYPDKILVAPAIGWVDNKPYENGTCWWADTMDDPTCRWLEDWYSEYCRLYDPPIFPRMTPFYPNTAVLGGHAYGYWSTSGCNGPVAMGVMLEYLAARKSAWNISGGHWINEYGPHWNDLYASDAERVEQMRVTTMMLEADANVARYAAWTLHVADDCGYWPHDEHNMLDCETNEITAYGQAYADTNEGGAMDCSVYSTANKSVGSGSWARLTYNAEFQDAHGMHSTVSNTDRLVCKEAGDYAGVVNVIWDNNSNGGRIVVVKWNDGGTVRTLAEERLPAWGYHGHSVPFFVPGMAVNDYIYFDVYQDSGATLNVRAATATGRSSYSAALWKAG